MERKYRLFKKKMRRIKNIILTVQATLNFIVFLISACCLDSESNIPTVVCCITLLWLALFCYANNWFEEISYTDEKAEKKPSAPVYHYSFDKERKVL
jgi:hypothetical protein